MKPFNVFVKMTDLIDIQLYIVTLALTLSLLPSHISLSLSLRVSVHRAHCAYIAYRCNHLMHVKVFVPPCTYVRTNLRTHIHIWNMRASTRASLSLSLSLSSSLSLFRYTIYNLIYNI